MMIHPIIERLLTGVDEALDGLGQEDGLIEAADYLDRWVEAHRAAGDPADLCDGVEDAAKAIRTEAALIDLNHGEQVPVPGGLEFDPTLLLEVFAGIRRQARSIGHHRAVEVCDEYLGTLDEPDEALHPDPDEFVGVAQYNWGVTTAATMLCLHFGVKRDNED